MEAVRTVVALIGTRPEAIKMAPLILELKKQSLFKVIVVSTGQHREMMEPILEFFRINPDIDLNIMKPGQNLNDVVTEVLLGLQKSFSHYQVDGIFVQGETASCMAASLWSFLAKIPVFHVEAGLRTGDLHSPWPEEFNRRITAIAATLHFAPTQNSAQSLFQEGILQSCVEVVGNTVIDALMMVVKRLGEDAELMMATQSLFPQLDHRKKLILATVHRRESFGQGLRDIFTALRVISERDDVQVVLPLHLNPQVRETAKDVLSGSKVIVIEPQSYVPFIYLMSKSALILSDSGGVQEEAPSLGKTVLVLRETTERPEALETGFCRLVGTQTEMIVDAAEQFLDYPEQPQASTENIHPFGVGDSSQRIVRRIRQFYGIVDLSEVRIEDSMAFSQMS